MDHIQCSIIIATHRSSPLHHFHYHLGETCCHYHHPRTKSSALSSSPYSDLYPLLYLHHHTRTKSGALSLSPFKESSELYLYHHPWMFSSLSQSPSRPYPGAITIIIHGSSPALCSHHHPQINPAL